MLFMLNGIAKLKDGSGKMAIIQNGSSLFSGDAGSGQSDIRKYVIENDWLDAIVQLPKDSFYNTPISTYIWIIDKNKPTRNYGRVLLINANECYEQRKKAIGNKRVDITDVCRDFIIEAYRNYRSENYEKELSDVKKIVVKCICMDSVALGYKKVIVESPLLGRDGNPIMKKGKPVPDTAKRDTESIPLIEDVDEYFSREILPYCPYAWIDDSKTKIGYEIPFTRAFYEYKEIEPASEIASRIETHEHALMQKLHALFENGGEVK